MALQRVARRVTGFWPPFDLPLSNRGNETSSDVLGSCAKAESPLVIVRSWVRFPPPAPYKSTSERFTLAGGILRINVTPDVTRPGGRPNV